MSRPHAETWLSPSGQFRLGLVRGAWMKPAARYIGHAAREAARRARLDDLATRLAELDAALETLESAAEQLAALRESARSEYARAPADDGLLRWHAEHNAAEQTAPRRASAPRRGRVETRAGRPCPRPRTRQLGVGRARSTSAGRCRRSRCHG